MGSGMRVMAGWHKALLLAGAMGIAGVVLAGTPVSAQDMQRATITVLGQGRASVRPDVAVLTTGVVSTGKTADEALGANSKAMEQVVAAVKDAGVDPKDIATTVFSIQPQYSYPQQESQKPATREPPKLVGYEVRNGVTVRVRDLATLGGLMDKVVQAGANQAGGLSFQPGDPDALQAAARIAAVKDGLAQASALADAAGLRLVRIRRIEPRGGDAPVMPAPMMMKAAESRAVPVEAGESEARAQMSIVFEVEPR